MTKQHRVDMALHYTGMLQKGLIHVNEWNNATDFYIAQLKSSMQKAFTEYENNRKLPFGNNPTSEPLIRTNETKRKAQSKRKY